MHSKSPTLYKPSTRQTLLKVETQQRCWAPNRRWPRLTRKVNHEFSRKSHKVNRIFKRQVSLIYNRNPESHLNSLQHKASLTFNKKVKVNHKAAPNYNPRAESLKKINLRLNLNQARLHKTRLRITTQQLVNSQIENWDRIEVLVVHYKI